MFEFSQLHHLSSIITLDRGEKIMENCRDYRLNQLLSHQQIL
ncbi:hypothetical protein NSP_19780 [Nodularia spumigena CCY9414]|nr:hypothetical protein NSP_19780 [Nodularia spumigena CCY9414]